MDKRLMMLILTAGVLSAGCHSFHVQHYVAPETYGRVLDAATHQPIPYAVVRRGAPPSDDPSGKGAQKMLAPNQTRSDKDGSFHLTAQKDLFSFGGGVYGASLTFLHSHYETLRTNFPARLIVRPDPKAPPRLDAGDIFLNPRADNPDLRSAKGNPVHGERTR